MIMFPNGSVFTQRTRALSETFGEQRESIADLLNEIYELEFGDVRAGVGVNAAVRGHFEHRRTPLVHNQHIARGIAESDVRAGELRIGRPAALVAGQPKISHVAIGPPKPRDGFQNAVGLKEVSVVQRTVS